jgi:hypothetical protein
MDEVLKAGPLLCSVYLFLGAAKREHSLDVFQRSYGRATCWIRAEVLSTILFHVGAFGALEDTSPAPSP